jgi:hypothetical protein
MNIGGFGLKMSTQHADVAVMIYICIMEILSANICRYTNYSDLVFLWYCSVPPSKLEDNASIDRNHFLPIQYLANRLTIRVYPGILTASDEKWTNTKPCS